MAISLSQHSVGRTMHVQYLVIALALLTSSTFTSTRASYVIGPNKPPKLSTCMLCNIGVTAFLNIYHSPDNTETDLRDLAIGLCLQLHIQPEHVCAGLVDQNLSVLKYIIDNSKGRSYSASQVCTTIFQESHCGEPDENLEWSVDLGNSTAPPLQDPKKSDSPPLTVVQLTDIHYDPDYAVGSNAVCGEPVCCHANHREAKSDGDKAGKWGDYRGCDISWDVVTDAFAHVKKQHQKIDYIYMTGDLVDHRVHATTVAGNNKTFHKVMPEMKKIFQDIPIFPCLGNHENHPVNVFPPSKVTDGNMSVNWLYETMADSWSAWLPASTRETILKGGYYTVVVRPGFRVISLNNNHCNTYNWWLLAEDNADPDGQLQWLVETLTLAEDAGEKVHVLYHIPTGNAECYHVWSREYYRIVQRFANTITAQFCGHTHYDELQLYYSADEPTQAINVAFNGGSLTSFKDVNPNYKVYSVDADNLQVLNTETWIYNLTAANLNPDKSPEWIKMYSFLEAFNMTSMSPPELDKLAHRMATDDQLFKKYYDYYFLLGDPKMNSGCNKDCHEEMLCLMVSAQTGDYTQCDRIVTEYRAAH